MQRPSNFLTAIAGTSLALLSAGIAWSAAVPPPTRSTYERDILPLMRARCFGCHGAGLPAAGLDIRTVGDLLEGGYSGPAVVPGAPEKSLLYQILKDGRMPKGGSKLSPGDLDRVARWIRGGAQSAVKSPPLGHWAFRPVRRPAIPKVKAAGRVRNPIDAFLLARLEREGLTFSPDADPRTLIRRVTFDLIGLPPMPAEVEAFVREVAAEKALSVGRWALGTKGPSPNAQRSTPNAYEKLVDRLLNDPRYGERWARHWLDTAGYTDSEGVLQEDRIRPNAWRYRDYVIRSFNADKPYDQFLQEQLAGDELVDYRNVKAFTPEVIETLTATGFLRTAVDATRDDFNAHQFGEYQYRMLQDTQAIVSTTALGLPIQCARCHDHKYEPLSQRDYYRMQALFMGAVRPRGEKLPTNRRQIIAATPAEQAHAKEVNAKIDAALSTLATRDAQLLKEYRLRYLEESLAAVPEADRGLLRETASVEEAKRTPEQKALAARHKPLLEATAVQIGERFPVFKAASAEIAAARDVETKKRVVLTEIRAFYDQDANPPATPILTRGDWLRPGETVGPGIPTVLEKVGSSFNLPAPPPGAASTGRRKAFAEWLTRPEHPLTARVAVNRIWAHHFGTGIVPTLDNFGRSGQPPTNPELLDWLAQRFASGGVGLAPGLGAVPPQGPRALGVGGIAAKSPALDARPWSLKSLHRLIVTSTAYRQASSQSGAVRLSPNAQRPTPNAAPEGLFGRQRQRRLDAEAIRDSMLAVSSTLR